MDDEAEIGAIAPSIVPSGTVTRRAVHKLWMTSANPKVCLMEKHAMSNIEKLRGKVVAGLDPETGEGGEFEFLAHF